MATPVLEPAVQANIDQWLNGNYDEQSKATIRQLLSEGKTGELTDAFYRDLEFGTGGIRGIMGVGSNRINRYTLGTATQGLSNYLVQLYPGEQVKVVIAHDCRNDSDTFARMIAEVFSANGIYVYFFEGLRPTPELSFAIRELGCHSGVMVTASHNPKEYNGYKAYGHDGGQLTEPHDENVMAEVEKIKSVDEVKFTPIVKNIETIGAEMDAKFLAALKALSISRDAIHRQRHLRIVFSPIHGTGGVLVPPVLQAFGFENVQLVQEQMVVDGNFPTVIYPNPEEKEALNMAIEQAKATDAELVMATDPDADRVGIAVRDNNGEFILLNGNQTASLLINYVMLAWKNSGKLTGKEYIVKTIVTSYLIDKMAAAKGIECFNTLTGFKWIGKIMTELQGKKTFLAGGEESYGLLVGEHARDKDAVVSCAMIAEMAAYYKDQGRSVYDALLDIYVEFGCYQEKLISLTKKGKSGAEEIAALMEKYRQDPPKTLGGAAVVTIKDYQTSVSHNLQDGSQEAIDLPQSNVLQFFTADGSIISARPSGTEPKIKFYCSANAPLATKNDYVQVQKELELKIDAIMKDLGV
ncbi:MAG: phosphoglucomutase [Bacteroidetes bacterium]|nr:MAG: phosphoglucomutase [Bacteroidota bacterium]PTM09518.1 MAG: phosphoglucomutase [Bacteroidota bacterium]